MKNEETGGARDPLQDIEKGKKERGFRVIWELLLLPNLLLLCMELQFVVIL